MRYWNLFKDSSLVRLAGPKTYIAAAADDDDDDDYDNYDNYDW